MSAEKLLEKVGYSAKREKEIREHREFIFTLSRYELELFSDIQEIDEIEKRPLKKHDEYPVEKRKFIRACKKSKEYQALNNYDELKVFLTDKVKESNHYQDMAMKRFHAYMKKRHNILKIMSAEKLVNKVKGSMWAFAKCFHPAFLDLLKSQESDLLFDLKDYQDGLKRISLSLEKLRFVASVFDDFEKVKNDELECLKFVIEHTKIGLYQIKKQPECFKIYEPMRLALLSGNYKLYNQHRESEGIKKTISDNKKVFYDKAPEEMSIDDFVIFVNSFFKNYDSVHIEKISDFLERNDIEEL